MPEWANRLLDALVASLLALFAPIQTMVLSTLALVVCDLITGFWVSKRRGIPSRYKGLKHTVVKLFVYVSAIALAFITEVYLTQSSVPVLNVVTSIIGITELKSCLENLNILVGGDVVKLILERISNDSKDNSASPVASDSADPSKDKS
jgi:hypothetical protein